MDVDGRMRLCRGLDGGIYAIQGVDVLSELISRLSQVSPPRMDLARGLTWWESHPQTEHQLLSKTKT